MYSKESYVQTLCKNNRYTKVIEGFSPSILQYRYIRTSAVCVHVYWIGTRYSEHSMGLEVGVRGGGEGCLRRQEDQSPNL